MRQRTDWWGTWPTTSAARSDVAPDATWRCGGPVLGVTGTVVAAAVLGVMLPTSGAAAAPTNSWPMAGYNAARSNLNPMETTLNSATLPNVAHKRSLALPATSEECGIVETSPVVNGTTLYTTFGTDVVAFDLTTGAAPIPHLDDPLRGLAIDSLVVSGSRMILSGRNSNDGTAYFAGYDTATLARLWGNNTCWPDPLLVVGGALIATCPTEGTPTRPVPQRCTPPTRPDA